MALWQLGRIVLEWREPGPMQGLEIVMRRRPLGEVIEKVWLVDDPDRDDERRWSELTWAERAERARTSAANIVELVVSWNIDGGDGEPAPVTAETLLQACDFDAINSIWEKYGEATTRVAPPLPSSSGGGEPSEETALQLPTEPLSASPQ